jgi:tetratricopeptide (TPR) repeat protein
MTRAATATLSLLVIPFLVFGQTQGQVPQSRADTTPFEDSLGPNPPPGGYFIQALRGFNDSMTAAEVEFRIGNFDKAIDLCDAALQTTHGRYASRALTLRGRAYAGKGNLVRALEDFAQAMKQNPRNIDAAVLMLAILVEFRII